MWVANEGSLRRRSDTLVLNVDLERIRRVHLIDLSQSAPLCSNILAFDPLFYAVKLSFASLVVLKIVDVARFVQLRQVDAPIERSAVARADLLVDATVEVLNFVHEARAVFTVSMANGIKAIAARLPLLVCTLSNQFN